MEPRSTVTSGRPSPTATIMDSSNDAMEATPRISVEEAKEQFAELERQLSRISLRKDSSSELDPEKGVTDDGGFNLREYLISQNAAQDEAGITNHHKRVGVSWKDLEVVVTSSSDSKKYVETFGSAVTGFLLGPFLFLWHLILKVRGKAPDQILGSTILQKNNGVLKPGEMCLVLGCPGAGCSTFLKTISNRHAEYPYVGGKISYAGIDAKEMAKRYKGEVVYNEEDDVHIPTLTVGQTLEFALSTKTPGTRLPGVSGKRFNETLLHTFLRMFNIQHTEHTLVGNAFVRGVSGGERKRVSLAEMMATRAHVTCWDNSTRGLDASTALDYVKSLRILTDVLQQTTFVALYQASESIYRQFDKVMVLDKGRQIYFGPISEARKYFISMGYKDLPRQTTPEYLTGCTDPNERQFAPEYSVKTVPSTPQALETAWRKSHIFQSLEDSRNNYDKYMDIEKTDQEAFRRAVLLDKKKGVSKKSPYTLGFWGQVWALTRRQFHLRLQDRFQLYTSMTTSTGLALVLGAAFFNLPETAQGGFTRGGVIFISMFCVACLQAFGDMFLQMNARPVLYKQTGYGFYRPSAIGIANLLADLPFSAVRIFIFDVVVYFMAGLARNAGAFFIFHLFMYLTFLTMQGFFRLFGSVCTNASFALRWANLFVPNFITYAGYFQPPSRMQRWLFWIYYISPMSYGYGALLENEFMRIDLPCDGTFVVPRNGGNVTKYPDVLGPNQVCTLFGSTPGNPVIEGVDYIRSGYDLNIHNIWRMQFLALIGLFLLLNLLQIFALEYYRPTPDSAGAHVFVPENPDRRKRNTALHNEKELSEKEEKEEKKYKHTFSGKVFTWEDLTYDVPVSGGQKRLLQNVFGYVKPGSMTALMGASGAGKTTCLDVLAQRKNIGVVRGDILVDGRPLPADFARGTAYAEQLDVHEETATVREAMRFSAHLRQPFSVPEAEKDDYVEELIELLELSDLADVVVKTLGVEARKRLTIGVELAGKPELLLFLDEPTSGLDAQSAWNLVRFLRKLADAGQAILCTIHQPSALLFESFDRLLLLQRGGETVYFGDVGNDTSRIREYFARYGAVCPPDANPAEYMLEAIGAGITPRVGDRDWKDIWLDSPEYLQLKEEIEVLKNEALSKPTSVNVSTAQTYATPLFYQVKEVTKRSIVTLWRSPEYIWTLLVVHVFIALFTSLLLLQLGRSVRDLQSRVFTIFFATVIPALVMMLIEPRYIDARQIFVREASSRIYSPYVFAISQLVSQVPYTITCGTLYWALMVWPTGFGQGTEGLRGNGYQLLMCIVLEFFGVSLGQLIASISPSAQVAALYNPFINIILSNFAGVTIPFPQMAKFWRSWLYHISPYTYALGGMLSTELHGLEIICDPDEFAIFNPPAGQTCLAWAGDFVSEVGGYLDNPNATEACKYCQYKVGDEFFEPLNIRFEDRWRNVAVVLIFFGANAVLTILASRFLRFSKR
ncbi:hypothetical protein M422DRAFT_25123 [Sphaerobolus stellatus SS14]|nr:hypothetical protein M422DRAFT_25123 [Sphaerobolus stellatus SS14]